MPAQRSIVEQLQTPVAGDFDAFRHEELQRWKPIIDENKISLD